MTTVGEMPPPGSAALPPVLVAAERHREELLDRGYRLEACGFLQRRWTGRDLWRAIGEGGVAPHLRRMRTPVYLAQRVEPAPS